MASSNSSFLLKLLKNLFVECLIKGKKFSIMIALLKLIISLKTSPFSDFCKLFQQQTGSTAVHVLLLSFHFDEFPFQFCTLSFERTLLP
ncbi:hypothetical protein T10_3032 [Trichinella papuae]|uniref:Uncharacterized protein n=1 Tax=Trichinella papuae TaxID=268474 RepID=A0A0V1MIY6_9BILA|nr:hypothetical protein T10_3032 [Trichinella papuae]